MSIFVSTEVWKHCPLSGDRLLLMLALADHSNDEGICWPSQKSLSERIRCTERGVQKMIDALIVQGEVVLLRPGQNRGKSAVYKLAKYADGKGEPEDRRANVGTRKGEPEDKKGRTSCSPESSIEPSIESSYSSDEADLEVVAAWNEKKLDHWQECKNPEPWLSTIKARLRNPWWREHWREALEKATEAKFLKKRGEWKPTIEWFLRYDKKKTVAAILEGSFDFEIKDGKTRACQWGSDGGEEYKVRRSES